MSNKYAMIKDGVIVNTITANADFANEHGYIECPLYCGEGDNLHAIGVGDLYQNGIFLPKPRDIQAEWDYVKSKRGYLLLASDINVLPDRWAAMTSEQQTAWSTYRQALRDIPTSVGDPADVVWPVAP